VLSWQKGVAIPSVDNKVDIDNREDDAVYINYGNLLIRLKENLIKIFAIY